MMLDGPDGKREVALGHPLLSDGFHDLEHDASDWDARWTDGEALLPLAALGPGRSITAVEIGIDQNVLFPVAPMPEAGARLRLSLIESADNVLHLPVRT